jgi:Cd2+/Zn2+-exporting ATPase
VLAAADAGVAMGLGTRAACEAADVILTDSDLTRLADTVNQSKKTVGIMKANIAFAIIVKFAVIVLGIIGIAPVWLAVIADVGTMIICVLNAARLLKVQRIERTVTSEISA